MDKEKKLREAERIYFLHTEIQKPERFISLKNVLPKMRKVLSCMRKAKTYMEKLIKRFMKVILMMKTFVFWGIC